MDFTIGCTLRYQVEALTPFVFNLEAVRMPRQRILAERLVTSPDLGEPDRFDAVESGNRFIRFLVPPGAFPDRLRGDRRAWTRRCWTRRR